MLSGWPLAALLLAVQFSPVIWLLATTKRRHRKRVERFNTEWNRISPPWNSPPTHPENIEGA